MEIEMKFMMKIMQSRCFLSTHRHACGRCRWRCLQKNKKHRKVLDKFNDLDV